MNLFDVIAADFVAVLNEGAGTMLIIAGQKIPAMVTEITFDGSLDLGGTRRRRTFSATCLRQAFGDAPLPAINTPIEFEGKTYRVSLLKARDAFPLTEIEFSER